jgi:hypothetical protein
MRSAAEANADHAILLLMKNQKSMWNVSAAPSAAAAVNDTGVTNATLVESLETCLQL